METYGFEAAQQLFLPRLLLRRAMVCTYGTCPVPPLWGCAGSRQARKRPPPPTVSWCTRPTAAPVPCRSVGVVTSSAGRKAGAGRLQIGLSAARVQRDAQCLGALRQAPELRHYHDSVLSSQSLLALRLRLRQLLHA